MHIFLGKSKFKKTVVRTGTALHETGDNWAFAMADYNRDGRPDLIAIKKSGTGTNSTEVHIIDVPLGA